MYVDIVKFVHLLFALGILGIVLYRFAAVFAKKPLDIKYVTRINIFLLILGCLAALTGTLLVYPKHFTFHTSWIQAAYLLMSGFFAAVAALILLRHKKFFRLLCGVVYFLLLVVLVLVVHDAVTKMTFLSYT